jgi:uncharacterized protein
MENFTPVSGLIGGLLIGLAAALLLLLNGRISGISGIVGAAPAVAALVTGLTPVFAFVAAMMAGMVLYAWVFERPDRSNVRAEPAKPEGLSRPAGLT